MTKEFFAKQIDRLRRVYSSSSLSDERVEILWEFFKKASNDEFEGGINYLIGEFTTQQLPPVTKFQDAVARFKSQQPRVQKDYSAPETDYSCPACRDFGYGWIGDTVTACVCEAGRKMNPKELLRHQKNYDNGARFMPKIKQIIKEMQERV